MSAALPDKKAKHVKGAGLTAHPCPPTGLRGGGVRAQLVHAHQQRLHAERRGRRAPIHGAPLGALCQQPAQHRSATARGALHFFSAISCRHYQHRFSVPVTCSESDRCIMTATAKKSSLSNCNCCCRRSAYQIWRPRRRRCGRGSCQCAPATSLRYGRHFEALSFIYQVPASCVCVNYSLLALVCCDHLWGCAVGSKHCCCVVRSIAAAPLVCLPDLLLTSVARLWIDAPSRAQVYGGSSSRGQFDAVLTCFFLDTAHNVLVRVPILKLIPVLKGKRHTGTHCACRHVTKIICDTIRPLDRCASCCRSTLRCCTAS